MARFPAIMLLLALALAASAAPSLSTVAKKLARSGILKAPLKLMQKEGDQIPEKCSSLYVAYLNCLDEVDDDDDDDDYTFDDDDDDDYDWCNMNIYANTNKTAYSMLLSGGLYSKACALTMSNTIDCVINEECQNTVDYASCPIDDCKYHGNHSE